VRLILSDIATTICRRAQLDDRLAGRLVIVSFLVELASHHAIDFNSFFLTEATCTSNSFTS
jgi:hypothetical protein